MTVYTNELKEQLVIKMLLPSNQSVSKVHLETGISEPTLYAWKKQYRERGFVVPSKSSHPNDYDARSQLAAVIKTAAMNEAELSVWCQEHGIYKEQLVAWKAAFQAISLIDEAVRAGVRIKNACEVIGISDRTFRRWMRSDTLSDGHKGADRSCRHALSEAEKEQMIEVCNRPELQSYPP